MLGSISSLTCEVGRERARGIDPCSQLGGPIEESPRPAAKRKCPADNTAYLTVLFASALCLSLRVARSGPEAVSCMPLHDGTALSRNSPEPLHGP